MPSDNQTQTGSKRIRKTAALSARDEFAILEGQAIDFAKTGGITLEWAELNGGDLALIFRGAGLCPKCSRPYVGKSCWSCGYEIDPGVSSGSVAD
jgi:hypothetical protein